MSGRRVHDRRERVPVAPEVGNQDLDAEAGIAAFELADGGGEDGGAAVGQIVTGDRGDDHVAQLEPRDGLGEAASARPSRPRPGGPW